MQIRQLGSLALLSLAIISCGYNVYANKNIGDGYGGDNSTILIIASKTVKPFVFKHQTSGEWDGFSLDFIKLVIPKMLNFSTYKIIEYSNNDEIFQAVLNNKAHIGHASITKNQERERFIDFSHTFFDSGFQVMVHNNLDVATSTLKFLSNFFTTVLLQGVIAFMIIWFICSLLIWIVDFLYSGEKNVRSLFRPEFNVGIRQAMIWTVSKFGGKSVDTPKNRVGIALSFLYDLIGIFIKALITAGITVVLSKNTSTPKINNVDDLPGNTVGTVVTTTSQDYLESIVGITMKNYESVDSMFDGFYNGEVDALVYDYPILIFSLQQRQIQLGLDDTKIVGEIFENQPYGIALKPGDNSLRENINQAILAVMDERNNYNRIYNKWFTFDDETSVTESDFEVSFIFLGGLGAFFIILLVLIFCCYKIKQYRDVQRTDKDVNIRELIRNEKSWKRKIELLQDDVEEDKYLTNAAMSEKNFLITRDIQDMLFQMNYNLQDKMVDDKSEIVPLTVDDKLLRRRRRHSYLRERHNMSIEDRDMEHKHMTTPESRDGYGRVSVISGDGSLLGDEAVIVEVDENLGKIDEVKTDVVCGIEKKAEKASEVKEVEEAEGTEVAEEAEEAEEADEAKKAEEAEEADEAKKAEEAEEAEKTEEAEEAEKTVSTIDGDKKEKKA